MAAASCQRVPFTEGSTLGERVFGNALAGKRAGTPLKAAIAATVAWYRTRPGTP